ncbi:MAG: hypothetical protein A3E82_03735 [Gammaproteobacteria bacterium RIFCSPHIGHO2_12_FULL_38_11]|nr:MAG: hypothetical protein A3E82_03735 [Gammaproteobacteria bacterium RIFCSPHIGHO2_12_FULL_38_11]
MSRHNEKEAAPLVSTIWVGPPATGDKLLMDIMGPLLLCPKNTYNHYIYWCLEAHFDHYRNVFFGINIQVCSIETYLEEQLNSSDAFISDITSRIIALIKRLLSPTRSHIRDCVTIVDAFKLYVLYVLGDFVLDTNVIPQDFIETIALKSNPKESFCMPCFNDKVDVWMLKATPLSERAKQALIICVGLIEEIERDEIPYSKKYMERISCVIMHSVTLRSLNETKKKQYPCWTWNATKISYIVKINSALFPLQKYYANSHYDPSVRKFRSCFETAKFDKHIGLLHLFYKEITYFLPQDDLHGWHEILPELKSILLENKSNKVTRQRFFDVWHLSLRDKPKNKLEKILNELEKNKNEACILYWERIKNYFLSDNPGYLNKSTDYQDAFKCAFVLFFHELLKPHVYNSLIDKSNLIIKGLLSERNFSLPSDGKNPCVIIDVMPKAGSDSNLSIIAFHRKKIAEYELKRKIEINEKEDKIKFLLTQLVFTPEQYDKLLRVAIENEKTELAENIFNAASASKQLFFRSQ